MNVHVSVPSETTKAFQPPNFLLKTPESKWLSIADAALDKHRSKLDQKSTRLAPWESNMRMESEGDVVYGSAIFLNNPVHIALHTAQNHSRACDVRSEVTLGTTSRADLGYFRNGQAYAILEYKKLGAVSKRCSRGEFDRGVPKDPKMFAAWMERSEHRFLRNVRGAEDTRALLQQAVHYYSKFGARFVALFDWNALVLLVLPPCQGVGLNDSVSYAYITEVTDNRKFRRALLGFLLFSYRHSISETSGDLEKVRPDIFSSYVQAYRRRVAEQTKANNSRRQGQRRLEDGAAYYPHEFQSGSQHVLENRQRVNQHPNTVGTRYMNSGANIYTTPSSNHSSTANSTVIHTFITLPSQDETRNPGRRIRKQPSSNLAAKYGASGEATVFTQNRQVANAARRPRQAPLAYSHGGRDHTRRIPDHQSTYNGNGYQACPGPSRYQFPSPATKTVKREKLSDNQKKEKNGAKFLGLFGRR